MNLQAPYILKSLQAARHCLDAMLTPAPFDPNDLIAGALALDLVATSLPDAGKASQVARELRVLSANTGALRTVTGQHLALNLQRTIQVIARLIPVEAGQELKEPASRDDNDQARGVRAGQK